MDLGNRLPAHNALKCTFEKVTSKDWCGGLCREHSGNIQGTFKELSGNVQGAFSVQCAEVHLREGYVKGLVRQPVFWSI
jgi:hypothetical protein